MPPIDGDAIAVNKGNYNTIYVLKVAPHFNYWSLYFPNTLFTSVDTFIMSYQQNTYHNNVPNANWQQIDNCPPCYLSNPSHLAGGISNYWMGWWQVTYKKIKNGVQSTNIANFYVGWGANVTDTIPW